MRKWHLAVRNYTIKSNEPNQANWRRSKRLQKNTSTIRMASLCVNGNLRFQLAIDEAAGGINKFSTPHLMLMSSDESFQFKQSLTNFMILFLKQVF